MQAMCFFTDCDNEVQPGSWKCHFHRKRSRCLVVNCANQVYARQLCVRHGGRSKCRFENCTLNRRMGNYCARHTHLDLKKGCTEPGCDKQAHARGKCVRHGGGRTCKIPHCLKHGRQRGYCHRHYQEAFGGRHIAARAKSYEVEPPVTTVNNTAPTKMSIGNLLNGDEVQQEYRF
ncbi:hypothetical protein AeRB84_016476 [Aphanomyces euteiches]|nr:hypothetical protein AeRB84_016476 [Aphanomyces euteiches]